MPFATRRRRRDERCARVLEYVRWGLPVCRASYPAGNRCSCQRLGCIRPGAHPVSPDWGREATCDPARIEAWLRADARLNFASPTGVVHDVLEVPAATGILALTWLDASPTPAGPVASAGGSYLFFTATRGLPVDEAEWWPCDIDYRPGRSGPEPHDEHSGPRWHSRGSYVLIPPSVRVCGRRVRWVRTPDRHLPDPLRVLDLIVDAQRVVRAGERARHFPVRLSVPA